VADPVSWPVGALVAMMLAAAPVDHAFPVLGETDYARFHHDYPATDVFAGCGAGVVSPVDGTVLEVGRRDRWDPVADRGGRRGGKFVSVEGRDGVRYYLSHLAGVRGPALTREPGARVGAGTPLGRVGRTGSARGTPCHVHVGLSPVCEGTGDWRVRRGAVPPFRFLRSWERDGPRGVSPGSAVSAWTERHGCP
jgi:peptidoglycan LD-endopeptidase LytH